jgi:hypothetical protein
MGLLDKNDIGDIGVNRLTAAIKPLKLLKKLEISKNLIKEKIQELVTFLLVFFRTCKLKQKMHFTLTTSNFYINIIIIIVVGTINYINHDTAFTQPL